VRVLIADDHAPTRAGVRLSLEGHGFTVCGEAADGAAAVAKALRALPDVCLLDINMPGGGGIEAAGAIAAELPDAKIVMLTVSRDDEDLFAALRAGAIGYLLKDTDPERLPHALHGVLAGEAALPRTLAARLIEEFRGRRRPRRLKLPGDRGAQLTDREWEVLLLLRDRLPTAAIAERLDISPVTVRRHVSAILAKLRAPDRAAAARLLDEAEPGTGRRPTE
jgi:DNA-binding NarL/FixJ family response regulator